MHTQSFIGDKTGKRTRYGHEIIVYRDSLVYVDKVLTETADVEKKPSRWARFKMKTGGIALIMIVFAIIYFML